MIDISKPEQLLSNHLDRGKPCCCTVGLAQPQLMKKIKISTSCHLHIFHSNEWNCFEFLSDILRQYVKN